jgi:DNA-binding response OmpR family regulator
MATHILLVDDDALFRRSTAFQLQRDGFDVSTEESAEDGLALARRNRPDLVLLDIGLPGMDGLEAVRLFQENLGIPVIFLTGHQSELDQVLGLRLGADDYITKPVTFEVLVARIRAVLRRLRHTDALTASAEPLQVGDLRIDPAGRTVSLGGLPVELRPREFDLLHTLALVPGRVIATDALLAQVWGAEYAGEPQVLYVNIRWLREKLEVDPDHPRRILTVRGVGYKLQAQEE